MENQIVYRPTEENRIRDAIRQIINHVPDMYQEEVLEGVSYEEDEILTLDECLTLLNEILNEFYIYVIYVKPEEFELSELDNEREFTELKYEDKSELEWYAKLDMYFRKLESAMTFDELAYEMKYEFCDELIDDIENYLR